MNAQPTQPSERATGRADAPDTRRQALALATGMAASALAVVLGLVAGAQGWEVGLLARWFGGSSAAASDALSLTIVQDIRLPRSLGAWLVGALLGLAGAIAQGLFRNPLADPYLLGSASGAALGVALAMVLGGLSGQVVLGAGLLLRWGLVGAAFAGALLGVLLTLALARGVQQTLRLLLAGVIVGVVLSAAREVLALQQPDILPVMQSFMLGQAAYLGWPSVRVLAWALGVALVGALALARVLDGLALGEDTARSLGLPVAQARAALVALMALATGAAVAQAGMVAFVGLVAPHLVRRHAPGRQRAVLLLSALAGGALLAFADALARVFWAPQELPVGVLTALVGGLYLLWTLWRSAAVQVVGRT